MNMYLTIWQVRSGALWMSVVCARHILMCNVMQKSFGLESYPLL